MEAKIYDTDADTNYTVTDDSQCKDKTDLSAYRESCRVNDVITMGKTVVVPQD